jgi:hypothetical protein
MAASLEKEYGIDIAYPMGKTYAGIGTATLSTLDASLAYLTAPVVRGLSAWSKEQTGTPLTITYLYTIQYDDPGKGNVAASYTQAKSLIEILIPRANSKAGVTGSSPLAILHEMGHAAHAYFGEKYGTSKLSTQWRKIIGDAAYGSSRWKETVFTSAYAATAYEEDFAETFSYGFVCNRAGVSIARYLRDAEGESTPLGKKVTFISQLLDAYMQDADEAVANLAKCRTAPATFTWDGHKLSGISLVFRGFPAPHNVLTATLRQLGIESASSRWEREVGGWIVTDTAGRRHLVFPPAPKRD